MTTNEQIKAWIHRIQTALDQMPASHINDIPLTVVGGISEFHREMEEFRRFFRLFTWALVYEDGDPEEFVSKIEVLLTKRK